MNLPKTENWVNNPNPYKMAQYTKVPRITLSRIDCICAETGKAISKGQDCLFDPTEKKAYHLDSERVKEFRDRWKQKFI